MLSPSSEVGLEPSITKFTIIIPTDFSNTLLLDLLRSILSNIPEDYATEIQLVEIVNESKDLLAVSRGRSATLTQISKLEGTQKRNPKIFINLTKSNQTRQKMSALLEAIKSAKGENVIIMNDDFTHPPDILPSMMKLLLDKHQRMVVGSRYADGGSIRGRTLVRKIIGKSAAGIARYGLGVRSIKDPISCFIAFPREVIKTLPIDDTAYSLSLEILVKSRGLEVLELPYCFKENHETPQKLIPSIKTYTKSIVHLYRYGPKSADYDKDIKYRSSVKFLSKAGRFYTVGASGLLVNYLVSTAISSGALSNLWYMHATLIGILVSISTNFFLNKIWTFQDRNFSLAHTAKQFSLFLLISSLGAGVQLSFVYFLVQDGFDYAIALFFAVVIASASNFLLNKKLTFKDKLWG